MARLVQDDALRSMVISPEHTVGIGKEVNDVHLPGLFVDANLGRIEFDWKNLMSVFFAEEALFRKLLSRMVCILRCYFVTSPNSCDTGARYSCNS